MYVHKHDKIPLACLPTPMNELPNATKLLGGPRLFIKRDDLTGLGFGETRSESWSLLWGRL